MIEIKNLHFSYHNSTAALYGIDVVFEDGKLIGVIGPNGAGKSTFLKNISGYLKPTAGRIFLDGIDISKIPAKKRAQYIAYVPQDTTVEFNFTCYEIVKMGRIPYLKRFQRETQEDYAEIRKAMEITKVWDLRDIPVTEISGGERQRVFIAKALCQKPKVLLLDEPVSHLDIKYQFEIMELLLKLSKNGIIVIAVMHDLSLAAQYCTEVVLLCEGRLVSKGKAKDVLTKENIKKVYGIEPYILEHPILGTPIILPPSANSDIGCEKDGLQNYDTGYSFFGGKKYNCHSIM